MMAVRDGPDSVCLSSLYVSFSFFDQVRASIRTFQPKERIFMEDNPKFSKKVRNNSDSLS